MEATRHREILWAIVRLLFGIVQIFGATTSLILLLSSAPIWLTATMVGITGVFTVGSRALFARWRA